MDKIIEERWTHALSSLAGTAEARNSLARVFADSLLFPHSDSALIYLSDQATYILLTPQATQVFLNAMDPNKAAETGIHIESLEEVLLPENKLQEEPGCTDTLLTNVSPR